EPEAGTPAPQPPPPWWSSRRRLALAALALAAAALAVVHWTLAGELDALQERAGDLAWRISADRTDERRLVVVDIDERSLREIGPWPWPRAVQAELLDRVAAAGASLQILDIVLP